LKSEYNQQLERITKIIGKKPDVFEQGINALLYIIENKVNPDIMPDTCCGKYKEVIGFDVIDRHNKKCFNDTLENIKKSMKDKDFPDIDFRKDIAEELSKDELIDRLCEMHKEYTKMREEWFNVVIMKEHYTKDTTDTLPYPNPISKHQTDINIGWMRAMKYMKDQPVKDITDEEIREAGCNHLLNDDKCKEFNE
jgi:hypothetical protein